MFEGEFIGGIFGLLAGMLADLGSYNIFGFNTLLLLVSCCAIGLLIIYLMKNSKINAVILSFSVLLLRGFLEYFFVYLIWNYENSWKILLYRILPTIIYSLVFVVPIYILFSKLYTYFQEKYNLSLE